MQMISTDNFTFLCFERPVVVWTQLLRTCGDVGCRLLGYGMCRIPILSFVFLITHIMFLNEYDRANPRWSGGCMWPRGI